jgi:Ca2+-transporting ATPase
MAERTPSDYYKLNVQQTLAELQTSKNGLTADEAAKRLETYGRNALPKGESASVFAIFIAQFKNIVVLVLLAAAVVSALLGDLKDVVIIAIIALLNAGIGTFQEFRAEQALAALNAMQVPSVKIRRGGTTTTVSAEELVPGDVVLLGEGDKVPADGRLIESANLQIEEAALTGESVPSDKTVAAIPETAGIGDRKNMVFMGTSVNYGRGELVVTGTGLKTELGKIASMLISVEETKTPLQIQIDRLGRTLVIGALGVVALVFVVGLLRGVPFEQMLITSIGLAVAAVPEGLPAVITIGLSLGAARMVKRNALIRRLPAVETLGSVTTICSDKTGTLTKNQMTTTLLELPGHEDVKVTGIGYQIEGEFLQVEADGTEKRIEPKGDGPVGRFLKAMALATDAYLEPQADGSGFNVVGDSTEGALLVAAQKVGWTREQLEKMMPRVTELPFSSERKAMTTVHEVVAEESRGLFGNHPYIAITKGAPDRLIEWADFEHLRGGAESITPEREKDWLDEVDKMASKGLRVLGVAYRPLDVLPEGDTLKPENLERHLYLLGLIGILDPARPEARDAVHTAKTAGIRPIMITGDHALTAEAIARDLGILEAGQHAITGAQLDTMDDQMLVSTLKQTSVFARVSPEHKMRLVKTLQAQNEIVAMTGDGVNDAPALKQANIGVAMGITGTEVSKGAADMVLTDDNFASIVAAVEEGRVIYENIRKFVRYLLSSNVGEILVMFLALLFGWPIPLLAIQILWINLVTDGLPAIALGFEPGEKGVMQRPPRPPQESIFARGLGLRILWLAVVLTIVTLAGYYWAFADAGQSIAELGGEFSIEENSAHEEALRVPRTVAFMVLALGQIFHVIGLRSEDSFFRTWFQGNPFMFWAVISTFILQLAVVYVPFLQTAFETTALTPTQLGVSTGLAAVVLFVVEIEKAVRRARRQMIKV